MDLETGEPEAETERYIMYWECALLCFLFITGVLANAPVLILYFRSRHIRSIIDKFLLNLLLADILSVVVLFPAILSSFIQASHNANVPKSLLNSGASLNFHMGHELNNETRQQQRPEISLISDLSEEGLPFMGAMSPQYWHWGCALSNGVIAGLAAASVLAALEIAVERYLAVVKPLQYHKFLTTHSIFGISIFGGIMSLVVAVISSAEPEFSVFPHCLEVKAHSQSLMFGEDGRVTLRRPWSSQPGSAQWGTLTHKNAYFASASDLIWALYSLGCVVFLFVFPVLLMLYIYTQIWIEARHQKTKISKQYKPYYVPTIPSKVDAIGKGSKIKEAVLPIIIKFRLIKRLRVTRLDRAGRVAIVALIVTILCWSPYYYVRASTAVYKLMAMYGYNSRITPSASPAMSWTSTVLPLLLAGLHPLLSPIFYAYRYKKMRTEICTSIATLFTSSKALCNKGVEGRGKGCLTNSSATALNISSTSGVPCTRQAIFTSPIITVTELSPESQEKKLAGLLPPDPEPVVPEKTCESSSQSVLTRIVCGHPCPPLELEGSKASNHQDETLTPPLHLPTATPYICINLTGQNDGHEVQDVSTEPSTTGQDGESNGAFSGSVVRMERSLGNLVRCLNVWFTSYPRRWLQHRESVTSTSSFITLLSNKHHKTHVSSNV